MIMTINNDATRKWSIGDGKLLSEFDRYFIYSECGWYCLALYKGDNRILHVHFNSQEERDNTLLGYGFDVQGNYMYKMTDEEKREREKVVWRGSDYPTYKHKRP